MSRASRARVPVRLTPEERYGESRGRVSLPRAGVVVAAAMAVGNALNYVFHVYMSRRLGPSSYGALGALLAVTFIVAVPGLALQTVVARHTALRRRDGQEVTSLWAGAIRIVVVVGVGLALLAVLTAPWIERFLHLRSIVPVLWLALTLLVLPVVPAVTGMLQGEERFGVLALILLVPVVVKLVLGITFVGLGLGLNGALAGAAGGAVVGCAVGLWMVRPGLVGGGVGGRAMVREVLTAGTGILALFVIVNIDIVLARHFLPRRSSGLYAVGSIVAKATYWAPRFVSVVVFPRLSTGRDRRALLTRSLFVVTIVSLVVVAAVALLSRPLLTDVFGRAYGSLGPELWLFAGIGTAFALVHLLLFSSIAVGDSRMSAALAVAVVIKTAIVATVLHHSVAQIAWVVFGTGAVMTAVGLLLESRRAAAPADPVTAAEVVAG
jgi:O-antigen/teichoic acid export membrane protein